MTEARINWDALRQTEGELPWEAIEGAVAMILAEPARWREIGDAYRDTLDEQDADKYLELYIAVILGWAGEKLSAEENQATRAQIADFLLVKLDTAALCGDEILEEDLRYAAGRIGPSILPNVLQRMDALAATITEDEDDDNIQEDTLWCLLPLAAKSGDSAIREQVAQRCMARLERVLRGEYDAHDAFHPMDILAQMRWPAAAELLDRLGREKENELKKAWLWADYLECNQRVRGIEPQENYPEWWDCQPREYLEKRHKVWEECSQDSDDSDDADTSDSYETPYVQEDRRWTDEQPYVREEPKVGRNDPCICGSGKKYKKCCGR